MRRVSPSSSAPNSQGEPTPGRLAICSSVAVTPASDRKSTRLNSSHGYISYAVFCLKKKNHDAHASHDESPAPPILPHPFSFDPLLLLSVRADAYDITHTRRHDLVWCSTYYHQNSFS